MKANNFAGLLGAVAMALCFTGCPGEEGPPDGGTPFPQPAGTVPLNFTIDASGRPGFYADKDLEWKGSFSYNDTTRILTYDSSWAGGTGPYAPLYDDGPWSSGGHEPAGATANDDKFGITVFMTIPTAETEVQYGAQTKEGGWIWQGTNGSLIVPASAPGTTALTATGMALSGAGNVDVKLTLDTNALDAAFTPAAATPVKVKGEFWLPNPWSERNAYDDATHGDATAADGIYTYQLSLDASPDARGMLLLKTASTYEFVWTVGGSEYKATASAYTAGTGAQAKVGTGSFAATTIGTDTNNGNTQFTAP